MELILQKYFICNVIQKKVAFSENTPTLLPFTIQFSCCFENNKLHYAGPLSFKVIVQNKMQKSYILMFNFRVSRTIHLDLTNDLGVELLKLAVHRFISRRGTKLVSEELISRL